MEEEKQVAEKAVKNNSNSRGKKTIYHPIWTPKTVKALLQVGRTISQVASELGIATNTLVVWARKYPELKKAIKEGRKPVNERVISALYKSAVGYVVKETIYGPRPLTEAEQKRRAKMKSPPPVPQIPIGEKKQFIRPNTTAQMFWLTNRLPDEWKDKHDMDISGRLEYAVIPYKDEPSKE